ncbi:MAG TPA: hypothetical protein ENJ82_14940 [Bacteroidetes bacterium]|nr:hypothetical protein [Bacteroidota bacterium]
MKGILPESLAQISAVFDRLESDDKLLKAVQNANEWFLPDLVRQAFRAMRPWFTAKRLQAFADKYPPAKKQLQVGIIMAGNLPLVGLHDLLCVLLSGHTAVVKLSSKDKLLLPALVKEFPETLPVHFVDHLAPKGLDYLLATGSDNTARYLEHSYAGLERIVRHNRFSVAIVTGRETAVELDGLTHDILQFHGMGCRSVSAVLVPEGYDSRPLAAALDRYPASALAPAWQQIQSWESSLAQMQPDSLPRTQSLTLRSETALVPARIGVLHLVHSPANAKLLQAAQAQIQCVVGSDQTIAFGQSQFPELEEFADGVDVMAALAAQANS